MMLVIASKTETTTQSIQEYFYDDLRPKGLSDEALAKSEAIGNQCSTHLSAKKHDSLKSCFFDGDGLRISRKDNLTGITTYFIWDSENPTGYPQVIEEIENNQVVRRYGYGLFLENVDIWNGTTFERYYVVRDGTNSVRIILNSFGNITDTIDYDAFGNKISRTGTTSISNLFHSEYLVSATNLVYLRSRWYSPETGRFLNLDRFNGDLALPTTLHKYSFVFNNPITYNDPWGLFGLSEVSITMSVLDTLSFLPNITRTQNSIVFPPLPAQFNTSDLVSPENFR